MLDETNIATGNDIFHSSVVIYLKRFFSHSEPHADQRYIIRIRRLLIVRELVFVGALFSEFVQLA